MNSRWTASERRKVRHLAGTSCLQQKCQLSKKGGNWRSWSRPNVKYDLMCHIMFHTWTLLTWFDLNHPIQFKFAPSFGIWRAFKSLVRAASICQHNADLSLSVIRTSNAESLWEFWPRQQGGSWAPRWPFASCCYPREDRWTPCSEIRVGRRRASSPPLSSLLLLAVFILIRKTHPIPPDRRVKTEEIFYSEDHRWRKKLSSYTTY